MTDTEIVDWLGMFSHAIFKYKDGTTTLHYYIDDKLDNVTRSNLRDCVLGAVLELKKQKTP